MKWKVCFWWWTHHNPFSNIMVLCWCFMFNFFDLSLKKTKKKLNWLIFFAFYSWSTTSNRNKSSLWVHTHPLFSFLSWNGPQKRRPLWSLSHDKKEEKWMSMSSILETLRQKDNWAIIHPSPPILLCLVFFPFPIHFKLTQLLFQGQL